MSSAETSGARPTNEQLISTIIETLETDSSTDSELLKVLSAHILKVNPSATAAKEAATDIETVAETRAEEPEDGHADHD